MKSIVIHGHRGSRGTSPENTIPSFKDAADCGAPFVELDVNFSKEKTLIVFHDYEISGRICRNADGSKVVTPKLLSDLTVAEIKTFDCGSVDAKIPTLDELILWKKSYAPQMRLNVEIKNDVEKDPSGETGRMLAKATLDLLKQHGILEESLVQSFDHRIVDALRILNKRVKLSCLFEDPAEFAAVAHAHGAEVAAVQYKMIDAHQMNLAKELGIEILPWTVNEEKEWDRLIDLGVEAIITDYPLKLSDFLQHQH